MVPAPPPVPARSLRAGVALCGAIGMAAGCLVAAIERPLLHDSTFVAEIAALAGFGVGALVAAVGALVAGREAPRGGSVFARLGTTGGLAGVLGAATAVLAAVLSIRAIAAMFFGHGTGGGAYGEAAGAVLFFIVYAAVALVGSAVAGLFVGAVIFGMGALHLAMDRVAAGPRGAYAAVLGFAGGALGLVLLVEVGATTLGSPTAPVATLVAVLAFAVAVTPAKGAGVRAFAPSIVAALVAGAVIVGGALLERRRVELTGLPSCSVPPPVPGVACVGYDRRWNADHYDARAVLFPDGTRPSADVARDAEALRTARCVDRPNAFSPVPGHPIAVDVAAPVDVRLVAHVARDGDATRDDAALAADAERAVRDALPSAQAVCFNDAIDLAHDEGRLDWVYVDCGARRCKVTVEVKECSATPCTLGTRDHRYLRTATVDVDAP